MGQHSGDLSLRVEFQRGMLFTVDRGPLLTGKCSCTQQTILRAGHHKRASSLQTLIIRTHTKENFYFSSLLLLWVLITKHEQAHTVSRPSQGRYPVGGRWHDPCHPKGHDEFVARLAAHGLGSCTTKPRWPPLPAGYERSLLIARPPALT